MRCGQSTGSIASTLVAKRSRMLSHISFRFRFVTSSLLCCAALPSGLVGGSDGLSSSHGSAHSLWIDHSAVGSCMRGFIFEMSPKIFANIKTVKTLVLPDYEFEKVLALRPFEEPQPP